MAMLTDHIQSADWKTEKHVPVIDCPDTVAADQFFDVTLTLGKAVAHPNTTEHHIRWIELYFLPDGGKFVYQVAHFDFASHGASVDGPNQGPVYTNHTGTAAMKTTASGTLFSLAYCNIHGLWQNSKTLTVR